MQTFVRQIGIFNTIQTDILKNINNKYLVMTKACVVGFPLSCSMSIGDVFQVQRNESGQLFINGQSKDGVTKIEIYIDNRFRLAYKNEEKLARSFFFK